MTTFPLSSTLTKPVAQTAAITALQIVEGFLKEINHLYPSFKTQFASVTLGQTILRVKGILKPIVWQNDVDTSLHFAIQEILNVKPMISPQLTKFWEAHLEMAGISANTSKDYNPMEKASENKDKILKVDKRYYDVTKKFASHTDKEIFLYALFYVHILKIDVIEYSFVEQFKQLLNKFNLNSKYDAEEIFSADKKIQKNTVWRTDGRAVRDALSHNQFELDFSTDPWKIIFNNTEKGYNFNKVYTKNEFFQFLTNTDFLYRCSLMLIFVIIASTITKQHFVIEKL